MTLEIVVTALATFLLALCLTGVARAFALSHGVLDVPNDRSSHNTPTPSGGGVAIVASTIVAASVLRWRGLLDMPLYLALCGGGLTVAVAGFLDDRRPLPAGIRLAAHFAAALWALFCLGGLPSLYVGHFTVHFGWVGYVLGALGIGWTLNLFNFMDVVERAQVFGVSVQIHRHRAHRRDTFDTGVPFCAIPKDKKSRRPGGNEIEVADHHLVIGWVAEANNLARVGIVFVLL